MPTILVHFQDRHPIEVELEHSETARLYLTVLRRNLSKQEPIWRDLLKYDIDYFKELCLQVRDKLSWNSDMENFKLSDTVIFHKDIEKILEKKDSFDKIPGEHQELLHEAHHCLHNMEVLSQESPRGDFLQFEWFNGDAEPIPADKTFKHWPEVGDIVLQNPYVGHPPMQCFSSNDYKEIDRTCAFQDRIKPALKIDLHEGQPAFDLEFYKKWWQEKCPGFVEKQGMDNIIRYTGWPVIGKVTNIEYLKDLIKIKKLKFERLEIL
jgi:hypothetical protein